MTNHVRIVESLGSRRIMGAHGKTRTLCGGEMTDRDIAWRDAKRGARTGELEVWLKCAQCREAVREVKS